MQHNTPNSQPKMISLASILSDSKEAPLPQKTIARILYDVALQIEEFSKNPTLQFDIISLNIFLPIDWQKYEVNSLPDEKSYFAIVGKNHTGFDELRTKPNDVRDYYHHPPNYNKDSKQVDISKMIWQWGMLAYEASTQTPFHLYTPLDRERVIKKRFKPKENETLSKIYNARWMGYGQETALHTPDLIYQLTGCRCWNNHLSQRPTPSELVHIMKWHVLDMLSSMPVNNYGILKLEFITGKVVDVPKDNYLNDDTHELLQIQPINQYQAFFKLICGDADPKNFPDKEKEIKPFFDEAMKKNDWVERLHDSISEFSTQIKTELAVQKAQYEREHKIELEYKRFCQDLFPEEKPTLLREKALKYFETIQPSLAPVTTTFSDIWNSNLLLGEVTHEHIAPKKFLIEKMAVLKKNGFDTLFMEHVFYDDQYLLDQYHQTGIMDRLLKEKLQYLNAHKHRMNKKENYQELWESFNFLTIVTAAQQVGIRVVGIDTQNIYNLTGGTYFKRTHEDRILQMNYTAHAIMTREIQAGRTKKWCALMGIAHVEKSHASDEAPGIADIMEARKVYLYDSNYIFPPERQTADPDYKPYSGQLNHALKLEHKKNDMVITRTFKGDVVVSLSPSQSIPSFDKLVLTDTSLFAKTANESKIDTTEAQTTVIKKPGTNQS